MTLISASILSADWGRLNEEVLAIAEAGVDYLHLDVMDGSFVPPITFGAKFVETIKNVTNLPLDVHLMINEPERHIQAFADAGAQVISVHFETCPHLNRTVEKIHRLGLKAGVAINPATSVSLLKDIVDYIDLLLVMTVNPGWGGQPYIPNSDRKIKEAAMLIKQSGRQILLEVDGGINDKTATSAVAAGAQVLVAGSYIFGQKDYKLAVNKLSGRSAAR